MRRAVLAIGALVGAVVLVVGAIDLLTFQDDEVAILVTFAPDGEAHETPLWIVEDARADGAVGELFVRAHSPGTEWLARLVATPEVEVHREGGSRAFVAQAVPDDAELRDRVNAAMSEKYGLADRIAGWIADPALGVPVRLRPARVPPGGGALGSGHP